MADDIVWLICLLEISHVAFEHIKSGCSSDQPLAAPGFSGSLFFSLLGEPLDSFCWWLGVVKVLELVIFRLAPDLFSLQDVRNRLTEFEMGVSSFLQFLWFWCLSLDRGQELRHHRLASIKLLQQGHASLAEMINVFFVVGAQPNYIGLIFDGI